MVAQFNLLPWSEYTKSFHDRTALNNGFALLIKISVCTHTKKKLFAEATLNMLTELSLPETGAKQKRVRINSSQEEKYELNFNKLRFHNEKIQYISI